MKKIGKDILLTAAMFIVTIIYTVLIKVVDVRAIGPNGTKVGFATLNGSFSDAIGLNLIWDKITDVMMVLAIITALSFVVIGVLQLIKRKNPLKVDKSILAMGGLYVIVGILYILFDKIALNYRPVLLPDEVNLEASFPSSHVMVICTIMGAALFAWKLLLADRDRLYNLMFIIVLGVLVISIAGRLVSGVHWLTDIVGGLLYSVSLIMLYVTVLNRIKDI